MGFESYHPAINLIYFVSVLFGTLSFRRPVFVVISFFCAFLYSAKRGGRRQVVFNLCLLPLILLYGLFYAGYHHFGVTVLKRNFIGNRMTLEALLCGLTWGTVLAAAVMWMCCIFSVFTTDKVVYLLGRVSPGAALFLAILLRMCPRMKEQGKKIHVARKAVGRGLHQGSLFARLGHGVAMLSMLITWLLESLGTLSDSMRSRGSGCRGRTAFSIYRFDNRDRILVLVLFVCLTVVFSGGALGQTGIRFDPVVLYAPRSSGFWVFWAGYLLLCLMPLALECLGEWDFSRRQHRMA